MNATAVLVDSREPAWVQGLAFGGVTKAVTMLEHGDLWLTTRNGTLIIVERKTVSDLLGSIRDGRIWPQVAGMVAQTRWVYVVICGRMSCGLDGNVIAEGTGPTGWNWHSVQGALIRIQELGAFVVWAMNDADYEHVVLSLAERPHDATQVVAPARTALPMSEAEQVLTALPGIGLEKVKPILEYAGGNAAWALTYLTDPQSNGVVGIGAGIKRNVRRALGLGEFEKLSVITNDEGEKENHGNAIS
jgi:ERCC4-type nuclease